jgi:hypothetical protein
MITFKQFITEMAIPRESDKAKVYYHGTSTEKAAKGIFEKGLDPYHTEIKWENKNGNMKPQDNRVYITPDLHYAMIYGIGGDMAGHDCTRDITRYGQYGFVFEFSGDILKDIKPDEDQVGEFVYYLLNKNDEYYKTIPKYIELNKKLMPISSSLLALADKWLTPRQMKLIKDGEYEYYAKGGKKLISKMSDEMLLKLIDCGTHVAHLGNLYPSKCYRFDRADVIHMKPDGSNFFEYAKPWKP